MRLSRTAAIFIALALIASPVARSEDKPVAAMVTDISDRSYQPAMVKLLDGAKSSITMSMYTITLSGTARNPISMLLDDLVEARGRGVAVTIYLNTRFKAGSEVHSSLEANPTLKKLRDAGCDIRLITPERRLHDKLVIVDERYVVEGSTNWSLSALLDNYESATLIDSPALARVKLMRLQAMLDPAGKALPAPEEHALYIDNMPGEIELPEALITDKQYFPRMMTRQDERAMDAYLVLSVISAKSGESEFFVDLESLALSLGLSKEADGTALRRQAVRWLKDLETNYALIEAHFFHGKDAHVKLAALSGARFRVSSAIALPDGSERKHSARVKFMRMVRAYLTAHGEDMSKIPDDELAERFGVSHWTVQTSRREM